MVSKGARRRLRQQRKELQQDIDAFLDSRNQGASSVSVTKDKDLFTVDTSGDTTDAVRQETSGTRPVIQTLTKPKKSRGIKKVVKAKKKSVRSAKKVERFFDIWADEQKKPTVERHPDAPTVWKGDAVPRLGKGPRPSIPAVAIDAPGCSFNPDRVQHQAALALKEQQEPPAKTVVSIDPMAAVYAQDNMVDELQQFKIGEDANESDVEADEETSVIHRPKIPERKTRTQRNKEERHKLFLKSIGEKKKIKKLNAQINNATQINRQITKEEKQSHLKSMQRRARKAIIQTQGLRKMGRKLLQQTPMEVLAAEEAVTPCLRRLHVSNDLPLDRYTSLQKRGLIDAGRFRGRKNKTKYTYSHPGAQHRRLEEAREEIPALQKRVQQLHNQLQSIKLSESSSTA